MKIFYLNRTEDESGVSGTGRIAQGFIFDNGKVCLTWLSEHPSVTIYDNIGDASAVWNGGAGGGFDISKDPNNPNVVSMQEAKSYFLKSENYDQLKRIYNQAYE